MERLNDKKSLRIFFLTAFGLPILLAGFMALAYHRGADVTVFAFAWMYLPAAGVMEAALAAGSGEGPALPKSFFLVFLIAALLTIALAVIAAFLPEFGSLMVANYVLIAASLVCLAELLRMGKARRRDWGLGWTKGGASLLGAGLFVLLYGVILALELGVEALAGGEAALEFSPNAGMMGLMVLINLPFAFLIYFGEEYGWRYFLQPRMQKHFGKRGGVLLLGLLWGLWHLPINLFYYSPDTWALSVLVQLAGCVGMAVFFGWLYMKTGNIWAAVLLHYLNNNLGAALFGADASGVVWTLPSALLVSAIYLAVYLPFLAAKEYRAERPAPEMPEGNGEEPQAE